MAVYDKYGNEMSYVYDKSGNELSFAYDKYGNDVYDSIPDIPVEPLEWNMILSYQDQITNALSYIKRYEQRNPNSYAFAQFNDVHEVYGANEPNFIDYNKGYKVLSRMVFNGDMVNNLTSTTQPLSLAFMNGASASKRLIGMGNHEYMITSGGSPVSYKTAINADVVWMDSETNALAYYSDDTANNVRYIVLDYYYVTKSGADDKHALDDAQLNWLASVMESAGDMDIIIIGHRMLTPYYNVPSGSEYTTPYTLANQDNLVALINAFKNRTTITFANTYDFSECTGDFILYTSGHYHRLGFTDDFGFDAFTTPTLLGSGTVTGFAFFIIDTVQKSIQMIICGKDFGQYQMYDGYIY